MKNVLFGICLALFALMGMNVQAQNILDENDETNLSNFYNRTLNTTKRAMPYPNLRQSDVIWESCIWRTIDFREKFNQFFYFPLVEETNSGNQGRINLANLVYNNVQAGEFEVFDDDELKIPLDWEAIYKRTNKTGHQTVGYVEDEYGEVVDEGHDSTYNIPFTSEEYYQIYLKEFWYIDKQDSRMKVRIIGLALVDNNCKTDDEGERSCSPTPRFWVPMDDMRVRDIFCRYNVYDLYNNVVERSYDQVFISRYFDSYVTRETNVYNRSIDQYLTGEDAQLESQTIEARIFDLESDMWEY